MKGKLKYLLTGIIVLDAAVRRSLPSSSWDYVTNPWTRDGQVRAQVIQITPRVSAPIVRLPIKDNQFVKAGDLLFEIDRAHLRGGPGTRARAELDDTRDRYRRRWESRSRPRRLMLRLQHPAPPSSRRKPR